MRPRAGARKFVPAGALLMLGLAMPLGGCASDLPAAAAYGEPRFAEGLPGAFAAEGSGFTGPKGAGAGKIPANASGSAAASASAPEPAPGTVAGPVAEPGAQGRFLGSSALLLDDGLVELRLSMRGTEKDRALAERYLRCVAIGYGLRNGYAFARHVRTNLDFRSGIWRADAVYTMSRGVPAGLNLIDIQIEQQDCANRGIPTA